MKNLKQGQMDFDLMTDHCTGSF